MDYGLGTSIVNGLKEGLIGYQTMRQIRNQEDQMKRQQQTQGLLQGIQQNQQTGQMEFTPEMLRQKQQEALIRSRQAEQYDPSSGVSERGSQLFQGLLGPKVQVPQGMSAAELKEYMPGLIAGMKNQENPLEQEYKRAQIKALGQKSEEEKTLPQNVYAAATYSQRLEDANKQINSIGKKYDPTSLRASMEQSGWFPERFKSEDAKMLEQAKRNFVNAVLRRESGSAISSSEFESADKQYFPQPGDTKGVLDQKERNREIAIAGLKTEGSKALPKMSQGLLQVSREMAPKFEQDVLNYAQKHNISPEAAQKIKDARSSSYGMER